MTVVAAGGAVVVGDGAKLGPAELDLADVVGAGRGGGACAVVPRARACRLRPAAVAVLDGLRRAAGRLVGRAEAFGDVVGRGSTCAGPGIGTWSSGTAPGSSGWVMVGAEPAAAGWLGGGPAMTGDSAWTGRSGAV